MSMNDDAMIGVVFGRLTVEARAASGKNWQKRWRCRCECGQTTEAPTAKLRSGHTKSCGCLRRELSAGANNVAYLHGHTSGKFSPTYQTWTCMIQRCTNPKRQSWKDYGARGIKVCERWMVFENFLADMGERPPGLTLDRRDNNGNYEPSNCRWATAAEQQANRRDYRVTPNYRERIVDLVRQYPRTVPELADVMQLHPEVVKQQIRQLRSAGAITTTPVASSPGSRGRTLLCAFVEVPHAHA